MTAEPSVAALSVDRLTKVYPGNVRALDAVSMRIATGERVCLLGPNGAGKTTLLRVITGALAPTEGSVALFGADSRGPHLLAARRRVGIVPQSPGMYRDLTVAEYLSLVQRLYRKGDIDATMRAFDLRPFADKAMVLLSGGWQRRLLLAAAVMPEPELLLLDEPTVGLDPIATREVHAQLREAMAGRASLLCTHNLAEAEALCDAVVIVRAARVLRQESIATLRAEAPTQLVLAATQGAVALARALTELGREGARVVDERVFIPVRDARAEAPGVLRALLAAGLEVYECRVHTPTLEELFIDVVRGPDGKR